MRNFSRGQFCPSSMGITPRYPKRHLQPQNPQRPTNPNNQITHAPHSFRPNATRAIEQDGLGGSPYLVSKIIPQREGFLLFSDLTPQGRRPRVGQPGRDEGLVPLSFRRGQKATSYFSDTNATRAIEQDGLGGSRTQFPKSFRSAKAPVVNASKKRDNGGLHARGRFGN